MRPMENMWRCHICGENRPDAMISVQKNHRTMPGGFEYEENVRYCNDKAECAAAAPAFTFTGNTKGAAMQRQSRTPGE